MYTYKCKLNHKKIQNTTAYIVTYVICILKGTQQDLIKLLSGLIKAINKESEPFITKI